MVLVCFKPATNPARPFAGPLVFSFWSRAPRAPSIGNVQDDSASTVACLAQFLRAPGLGEREHPADDRLDFPGLDQFQDRLKLVRAGAPGLLAALPVFLTRLRG